MGYENRKHAIDKLLAYEDKVSFETVCRCTRLFSTWAAQQLGMPPAEIGSYAAQMVIAKMEGPGFDRILDDVKSRFEKEELEITDRIMFLQLDKCMAQAQRDIATGTTSIGIAS